MSLDRRTFIKKAMAVTAVAAVAPAAITLPTTRVSDGGIYGMLSKWEATPMVGCDPGLNLPALLQQLYAIKKKREQLEPNPGYVEFWIPADRFDETMERLQALRA